MVRSRSSSPKRTRSSTAKVKSAKAVAAVAESKEAVKATTEITSTVVIDKVASHDTDLTLATSSIRPSSQPTLSPPSPSNTQSTSRPTSSPISQSKPPSPPPPHPPKQSPPTLTKLIKILIYFYLVLILLTTLLAYSPTSQRQLLFLHNLRYPLYSHSTFKDLSYIFGDADVSKFGISNVQVDSGFLEFDGRVRLKGYRLNPPLSTRSPSDHDNNNEKVIIFFHGNGSNRALSWRLRHVKLLADTGCIVYSFDLRGYGDSSLTSSNELVSDSWVSKLYDVFFSYSLTSNRVTPTEDGVIEDGVQIYKHVREIHGEDARVYLYGHSLGTGVSSSLVSYLCNGWYNRRDSDNNDDKSLVQLLLPFTNNKKANNEKCKKIDGLILDSPFTSLSQSAVHHPSTFLFRTFLPFSIPLIAKSIVDNFDSHRNLMGVDVRVLIMQGDMDRDIPPRKCGGVRLHDSVAEGRWGRDRGRSDHDDFKGDVINDGPAKHSRTHHSVKHITMADANHENVHEQPFFKQFVMNFVEDYGEISGKVLTTKEKLVLGRGRGGGKS